MNCARKVERERFEVANANRYEDIVWLVITDSPQIGKAVIDRYNGKQESVINGKTIARQVITTSSEGIQTRPAREPNTGDFADAALDWYLIGESDVAVAPGAMSFGTTAALRTAIPLYMQSQNGCQLRQLDHDGSAVIPGFVQLQRPKAGGPIDIIAALKAQGFKINGNNIVDARRVD